VCVCVISVKIFPFHPLF